MSEWLVHLVRVAKVGKHPNADSLDITSVYGQSVICQRGLFTEGDLAVFVPPDSVMPVDPNSIVLKDSGLAPGHRVEAKKLRGIFSNGFLIPAKEVFSRTELAEIAVGAHVADRLGITKYIDAGDKIALGCEDEKDPGYMPVYTDIEPWPKLRNEGLIVLGDEVVLTEKIHGANARFCYRDARLWVGSHVRVKAQQVDSDGYERNLWWSVAKSIGLEEKMKLFCEGKYLVDLGKYTDGKVGRVKSKIDSGISLLEDRDLSKTILYGEVYGQVQDLKYGVTSGAKFRLFDSFDGNLGKYNDWDVTVSIASAMNLDLVPVLYRGPWKPELEEMRNGASVLYPGNIREGYVVKPVIEGWSEYHGRKIFKHVGEDYKTRKRKS